MNIMFIAILVVII